MAANGNEIAFFSRITVSLGVLVALTACGPTAPEHPTWEADVRPIIVSRCVRCHNAQDKATPCAQIDSKVTGPLAALAPMFNFDYASLADLMGPGATGDFVLLKTSSIYVGSKAPAPLFMPPPPAEALSDWQIETLDKWGKNPL